MHEFSHNATLRVAKVSRKQAGASLLKCRPDEWARCLTARDVRCLHFDRGAGLALFVGRYQQFIRKICLCIDKASFSSYADCYRRAFKRRGRTISRETKCGEDGRLFGSALEELGNFEGRTKSECTLAGLEAEAGCRN